MKIDNKFDITDTVYLITDKEQCERIVTSIQVKHNGLLIYELSYGAATSWHYDFEITTNYNLLKATSN